MKFYNISNVRCACTQDINEIKDFLRQSAQNRVGFYSIAINAEKLIRAAEDEDFQKIVNDSLLPVVDGIGANLFLLRNYRKTSLRVNLPLEAVKVADEMGLRLGVIGGSEESNSLAVNNLLARYKNLKIPFRLNGYSKNIIGNKIIGDMDMILLGLGSPLQEYVAKELNRTYPSLIIINCGGAIDVFSGLVKRAPYVVQLIGIEWLYRLLSQPHRFKRQIKILKLIPHLIR